MLFVIAGCVTSQFKNLGSEIFENGSKVDWESLLVTRQLEPIEVDSIPGAPAPTRWA